MDSPQQVIEEAREQGYYVRRNVDITRKEFLDWCTSLSTPWNAQLHKMHTETFDDDNIVTWSNKTRFKGHSLPWHADNPWHKEYKFPLRPFWAEKIASEKDIIYYLNITKWFEDQDESTKQYFRTLKVLVQDYKGV